MRVSTPKDRPPRNCLYSCLIAIVPVLLALIGPSAAAASFPTPLSVVKQLYAAFDRGDMAALLQLVSPNVVWTQYGPKYAIPFAGEFHGRAGVAHFFALVNDTLTDVHAGQREFLVSGNEVIVPGWEESTVRSTGGHYRVHNVHIFRVVDGQIDRFEEYIDSADVLEALTPANPGRGRGLFRACERCHGDHAEGQSAKQAPDLTGLGQGYLVLQLRRFRAGISRGNASEAYGTMIGPARALPGDRGVRDVAAYIESLPLQRSSASIAGDVQHGGRLYAADCARCHGASAEGNRALGAPPLRQQSLEYMHTQLIQFASEISSVHPSGPSSDVHAAVKALAATQALDDVLAFIKTR